MELYDIKDYYKEREVIENELEDIIETEEIRIVITDCDAEEELVKYWRKYIVHINSFV